MLPSDVFYEKNKLNILLRKINKRRNYIRKSIKGVLVTADYMILIDNHLIDWYNAADRIIGKIKNYRK